MMNRISIAAIALALSTSAAFAVETGYSSTVVSPDGSTVQTNEGSTAGSPDGQSGTTTGSTTVETTDPVSGDVTTSVDSTRIGGSYDNFGQFTGAEVNKSTAADGTKSISVTQSNPGAGGGSGGASLTGNTQSK